MSRCQVVAISDPNFDPNLMHCETRQRQRTPSLRSMSQFSATSSLWQEALVIQFSAVCFCRHSLDSNAVLICLKTICSCMHCSWSSQIKQNQNERKEQTVFLAFSIDAAGISAVLQVEKAVQEEVAKAAVLAHFISCVIAATCCAVIN